MSDRPPVSRRGFFRGLLLRGIEEVQQVGQRVAEALPDVTADSPPKARSAAAQPGCDQAVGGALLRPPGALPEPDFLDACTRCGDCLRACPAQCIVVAPSDESSPRAYPHIIARTAPCVVCEELACMKVCPTDALQLTQSVLAIAMGKARVNHATCLRAAAPGAAAGEDCRLCITQCPIGEAALALDAATDQVQVRDACIGCGVCERACPTEPASIIIEPARA